MRALAVVLVLGGGLAFAAPLKSPWDGKVVVTDKQYVCPDVAHVATDIQANSPYLKGDPTHSIIDPVADARNKALVKPFYDVQRNDNKAADAFRTTGSRAAARCAITQITTMARENAMGGKVPNGQPIYVQGWVAGSTAVDWLKVRQMATPEENRLVGQWLHALGRSVRAYYDPRTDKSDGTNNHSYWAGFALAAIGIADDNRNDFDWGIKYYDRGVAAIHPDGTLDREMDRASRALHYHLYALTPLIMLAELGEVNGLKMYEQSGGAIHRLVKVCVDGYNDPSFFEKKTGKAQERKPEPTGGQFAWTVPYLHRFPDHPEIAKLAARVESMRFDTIGGLPPQ
ncbi:MAG: alginate lyase family protein [Acidobacteria bacterium]|nr:alginate lyase family protein [Acidobacteriota bacterium]